MSAFVPRWLLAPNPSPMTMDGTRTYFVGARRAIVIDPGPMIPAHLDAVVSALRGAEAVTIVCTHSHADHAGAAAALATATGAALWSIGSIDETARDGPGEEIGRLETDHGELRILATPGHTPDHVSIHWTAAGASRAGLAFVGDLLMGAGDTTLVGFPEGNVADYLSSLDLIESLECTTLYPAHGPQLTAPLAIRRHRDHRLDRVEQIRRLIEEHPGVRTDKLVELAYGGPLDPRLRAAARASVKAIEYYLGTVIDLDIGER